MEPGVLKNKQAIMADCARRDVRVRAMPFYYHIKLFMPCNQKCIMCKPNGNRTRGMVTFEAFVEFLDRIKAYAEHLTLIGGETLLYPRIKDVIDLLSRHEIGVTIHTNGTVLGDDLCRSLVNLHELHLRFSVDAATGETYHRIRGTDSFDRVKNNLERFSRYAAGRHGIKQMLNYVVMRENIGEVLPFIDYAKTLNPAKIIFNPVRHVQDWTVENGTGWSFDGRYQSCESFRDEYNGVMREAARKCETEGIDHAILFLR